MVSCLLTSDERLIAGERAGGSTDKQYAFVGGSIAFKQQQQYTHDPITDAFLDEARAELGSCFTYKSQGVIGITQSTTSLPGLKFVVHGSVDASFHEIAELHREAVGWYEATKKQHGQQKARETLAQHSRFPPDAWEHSRLIGLFKVHEELNWFIRQEHVMESARDALAVYLTTVFTGSRHPSFVSHAPSHASILRYPAMSHQIL